jgi:hypothetical protein
MELAGLHKFDAWHRNSCGRDHRTNSEEKSVMDDGAMADIGDRGDSNEKGNKKQ